MDNVWHFGLMAHRMVCRAPKPLGGAGTTPVSEHPVPEPHPAESAPANVERTAGGYRVPATLDDAKSPA